MAAAPVKSPLHNFPLTYLKWGSKKDQQRCHSSKHHLGSRSSRNRRHPTTTNAATPSPQTPTTPQSQTHDDNNNNDDDNGDESNRKNPETNQAVQEEGWNLRPRRASTATANAANTGNMAAESSGHDAFVPKSTRLRGFENNQGNGGSERREEKRFFIALSRDEIEEDIYSMTGSKPSRRPKKRPKNVQKQVDNVFPGLWLVGFTPETYRGFDFPLKR